MTSHTGEVTGVVVVGRNLVEQRAMETRCTKERSLRRLAW